MGKAGGVAFGKAVFAKALDLVEAAGGKGGVIAALNHAAHHFLFKPANGATSSKRRHGLAQFIEFARCKLRRHHGQLHGLFLKQRHTLGAAQHLFQFVGVTKGRIRRWVMLRLQPITPAQIWMHHITLNGTGADDGDFNDEIIKAARLQARQHVHLRTGFDLKHAKRIRFAQHVVNRLVFTRHGGEVEVEAIPLLDQFKTFANAGEHAQCQHINLQHGEGINVVLVPGDEGAVVHGGIADGHGFVQALARENKAAHML